MCQILNINIDRTVCLKKMISKALLVKSVLGSGTELDIYDNVTILQSSWIIVCESQSLQRQQQKDPLKQCISLSWQSGGLF